MITLIFKLQVIILAYYFGNVTSFSKIALKSLIQTNLGVTSYKNLKKYKKIKPLA